MTKFESILEKAYSRYEAANTMETLLPSPDSNDILKAREDADYLSLMSRRIFRAGLKHSMVDAKWPAFEKQFHGFDIEKVRMMSDDDLDKRLQDKNIIRHWGKIKAVRNNAEAIHHLHEDYASIGEYLASCPNENLVGLWDDLKKRFSQLGGMSGPYFLRMAGRDTFLLTNDVLNALSFWNIYQGKGTSKRDQQLIQNAFNVWADESQRPFCQISRVLALSIET